MIGIDPWIFNSHNGLTAWKAFEVTGKFPMAIYKNLIKPDYFYTSLKVLFKDRRPVILESKDFYSQTQNALRQDGSRIWGSYWMTRWDKGAIDRSNKAWDTGLQDYNEMDLDLIHRFDGLLDEIEKDGVRIVFWIPPFHPGIYGSGREKQTKMLEKTEKFLRETAKERGIDIVGSMDPKEAGARSEDFFDSIHLTNRGIMKVFGKTKL